MLHKSLTCLCAFTQLYMHVIHCEQSLLFLLSEGDIYIYIYIYIWSPSHPQHFMGCFLGLLPNDSIILGSFLSWLSLRTIFEEWWLMPFISLPHLTFLIVFPILLESFPSSILLINTFFSPYDIIHCLGILILNLVIVERRYPTHKYLNFNLLIIYKVNIPQQLVGSQLNFFDCSQKSCLHPSSDYDKSLSHCVNRHLFHFLRQLHFDFDYFD
jgi:hypothetical protein